MSAMDPAQDHGREPAATIPAQVGGRVRGWWDRPGTRGVIGIWAVMTAALVVFSLYVPAHLMGTAASPTMRAVKNTMTVFTVAASPVAAAVWSVALYSLLAWRHRGSGIPDADGPPIRGNAPITAIWLVLSSLLCVFLLIWGLAAMQSVTAAAAGRVPLEASSGCGASAIPPRATCRAMSCTYQSISRSSST
jgi:heme/copper-type cytochrome/quinol oxidase subunit 2